MNFVAIIDPTHNNRKLLNQLMQLDFPIIEWYSVQETQQATSILQLQVVVVLSNTFVV
jgi:hypothetical protein